MSFQSLSDILQALRKQNQSLKRRMDESQAVLRWERAVGPLIAKHAQVLRVVEGVLWIEVDHPIWKTELQHRKAQILLALNQNTSPAQGLGPPSTQDSQWVVTDLYWVEKRHSRPKTSPHS